MSEEVKRIKASQERVNKTTMDISREAYEALEALRMKMESLPDQEKIQVPKTQEYGWKRVEFYDKEKGCYETRTIFSPTLEQMNNRKKFLLDKINEITSSSNDKD